MRILNVSQNYFVSGGMDVVMFELEHLLRAHGHIVVPFAAADRRNRSSPYAHYFPAAPPTIDTKPRDMLRTLYSPTARRAIGRVLDEERIDLVHLHSYFKRLTPSILPEIARRGIPIVQSLHEYRAVCPVSTLFRDGRVCTDCRGRRYHRAIAHRCAGSLARSVWNVAEMWMSDLLGHKREIALFLAISNYQRDMVISMGLPADRVTVVPNPVTIHNAPATPSERSHVLYFGRLEDYKGIFVFLELAERLPHLRFAIAGEGSCTAEVAQRIASGTRNVHMLGMLRGEQLSAAIAGAICVVIPSLWPEAFGLTCVEALSHATPVVASAVGGITEIVRDGIDGFLVEAADVESFSERVAQLAADPGLARIMGENGRLWAEEKFSPESYYQRVIAAYDHVLADKMIKNA